MYKHYEKQLNADQDGGRHWIAEKLGVQVRQIGNYRNGKTKPSKLMIEKMQSMINNGEKYES